MDWPPTHQTLREIGILSAVGILIAYLSIFHAQAFYGKQWAAFADFEDYCSILNVSPCLLFTYIFNACFAVGIGLLIYELAGGNLLAGLAAQLGFSTSLILGLNLYAQAFVFLVIFTFWLATRPTIKDGWKALVSLALVSFWHAGIPLLIAAAFSKLMENRLDRLPIRAILIILFGACALIASVLILLSPLRLYFSFIGTDLRIWLVLFTIMAFLAYRATKIQNALMLLACLALIAGMADLAFFFVAEINFWRIMVLFEYSLIPILAQDRWGANFLKIYIALGFLHFFI